MGDMLRKAYDDAEKRKNETVWKIEASRTKYCGKYKAEIYTETLTEKDLLKFWYEFAWADKKKALIKIIEKRRAEMNKRYDRLVRKIKKLPDEKKTGKRADIGVRS